jgi:hypothetical protein
MLCYCAYLLKSVVFYFDEHIVVHQQVLFFLVGPIGFVTEIVGSSKMMERNSIVEGLKNAGLKNSA